MSLCTIIAAKTYNHHPMKSLHVEGGKTSNGTKIVLSDKLGPGGDFEDQLWVWTGTLFICYKNPIKCIHLTGTGNGSKIQLFDILSNSHPDHLNQEWFREGKDIVSRKSASACWHITGDGTGNGTKIQLWNEKNHENGSWIMQKLDKGDIGMFDLSIRAWRLYMIVPLKSPGKTVHRVGGGTGNGTKIQLWDRVPLGNEGYEDQLWLFNGFYFLSSRNENKSLHLDGGRTENGTKILLWDFAGGQPNELWNTVGKNIRSWKNKSACWHLEDGGTGNGTKIVLRNEMNHENGAWKIEAVYKSAFDLDPKYATEQKEEEEKLTI